VAAEVDVIVNITFAKYGPTSFAYRRVTVTPSIPTLPAWQIVLIVIGVLLAVFLIFAALNYFVVRRLSTDQQSGSDSDPRQLSSTTDTFPRSENTPSDESRPLLINT